MKYMNILKFACSAGPMVLVLQGWRQQQRMTVVDLSAAVLRADSVCHSRTVPWWRTAAEECGVLGWS